MRHGFPEKAVVEALARQAGAGVLLSTDILSCDTEAYILVAYANDKQRALIFRHLWAQATPAWKSWARRWLLTQPEHQVKPR